MDVIERIAESILTACDSVNSGMSALDREVAALRQKVDSLIEIGSLPALNFSTNWFYIY